MPHDLDIELHGETLTLLPERAVFWRRLRTLLVADVHWGKAATFRSAALAVPDGMMRDDLERLSQALERTGAQRLVFLGDLLHAQRGRTSHLFEAVAAWRTRHAHVELTLVRGNHDHQAGDPPPALGIRCVDEPSVEQPFVLRHHPEAAANGYVLAGHIHPAVVLTGAGRQQIKLPCFVFGKEIGILPAFGSFTGTAIVRPAEGDRVYVLVDDEVIAVS